jgi:cbb3-type cytochrome oxidase subunit 3
MPKKKSSIILIALLTLLLIALVIWFFNKKIEKIDKAYTGSLDSQQHLTNRAL